MKLTLLGHSVLLIETDQIKAIIDPFLQVSIAYKNNPSILDGLTHIFITHAHGDHIGSAVELALKYDALIITNAEIASTLYYQDNRLKLHPMHIGGRFKFDFGTVKMTPALHGSGYTLDGKIYDGGNPGGFVIKTGEKTVYHAGDTGLTYDMKLLAMELIDVAFLPIGGNYTMDIDDAVIATSFIKPKSVIPMHYNTFDMIKADPNEFKEKVKDCKVFILKNGETIEI
jgi:L-ascorbate metabolism protein UlaG (beta-lactamase superfamily)